LEQIAALKGLHKSSVRRILYETLRRLRAACPGLAAEVPYPSQAAAVPPGRLESWTNRERIVQRRTGKVSRVATVA